MTTAHRRKKDPEQVRRSIIESAMKLSSEQGFSALSLQAIARDAGVTKGGLLHHFSNKQVMLDAVFKEMLSLVDSFVEAELAQDTVQHGRFTRAYINMFKLDACCSDDLKVSISMIGEPTLNKVWLQWFGERMVRHADTDAGIDLEILRLAADGLWLANICKIPVSDQNIIREQMIKATFPPKK